MKPLAAVLIILFSFNLLCRQDNRLAVYTGHLTSTVDCGNSYSKDDALVSALYAEIYPFSAISLDNYMYASPSIHHGGLISNKFQFWAHPFSFSFGDPFIGAGIDVNISKSQSESYQTQQHRYLSYVHIGHSFLFNDDSSIAISPWTGAGKTTAQVKSNSTSPDVSDITDDDKSLNILNGITLEVEYLHNFFAEFTYIFNYNHTESRGFNSISAMINTYLYKDLGISYRFQYTRDMCNEDILNSIGLSYSGF